MLWKLPSFFVCTIVRVDDLFQFIDSFRSLNFRNINQDDFCNFGSSYGFNRMFVVFIICTQFLTSSLGVGKENYTFMSSST